MFSVTVAVLIWILSSRVPATYARAAVAPMCRSPRHRLRAYQFTPTMGDAGRRPSHERRGYAMASTRNAGLSSVPTGFLGCSSSTSMSTGRLYLASRSAHSVCSIVDRDVGAWAQRDIGDDDLAEHAVRTSDDGGLEDAVVAVSAVSISFG